MVQFVVYIEGREMLKAREREREREKRQLSATVAINIIDRATCGVAPVI
jgi:hypothetical protein